ncbi:hypothetical protein [Cryobacterium sp. PH31-O1]|uniref:hypothetical protein n=1 Tax=Cryobacterium sp. PH31-O1 TaxID=3046306 RepID=UPI0024B974EE|nr:hypothetical protein [Cryobacterium sp. PH31-O1]MDJ0339328.1 hypothetical protein [Cryobacterium sp. PH31-O1]
MNNAGNTVSGTLPLSTALFAHYVDEHPGVPRSCRRLLPKRELVDGYRAAGGTGLLYCEAPLAWAPTEEAAVKAAHTTNAWSVTGWKVMAELPNLVNFEAAAASVREDDIRSPYACGPDVERHLEVIGQFTDAGFDHVALMNAGPDQDGFFDFFERTLRSRLLSAGSR